MANEKVSPERLLSKHKLPEFQRNKKAHLKLDNPNVKFIETEMMYNPPDVTPKYVNSYEKKLFIKCHDGEFIVSGHATIGRAKINQVELGDEGVSRAHAEVVPNFNYSGKIFYCLKDIGSRFGTFV